MPSQQFRPEIDALSVATVPVTVEITTLPSTTYNPPATTGAEVKSVGSLRIDQTPWVKRVGDYNPLCLIGDYNLLYL